MSIEIPKVLKTEIDEIKTPSNRLLILVLILGILTLGWLSITRVTSRTVELKKRIEDLEEKLVRKNETIGILNEKISNQNKAATDKLEVENARLMERILMQEKTKVGLRK